MSGLKHKLVLFLFFIILVNTFTTNRKNKKSNSGSRTRTNVSIVYSSNCKPCAKFIHDQLVPTYRKLPQYMIIKLNPNGKSKSRGKKGNNIGNQVQGCVLKEKGGIFRQLKFIDCYMSAGNPKNYQTCAYTTGLDTLRLAKCLKRNETAPIVDVGNLPHIMFNGKVDKDLEKKAKTDFFAVICELSKYPRPCDGIKQKDTKPIDKCDVNKTKDNGWNEHKNDTKHPKKEKLQVEHMEETEQTTEDEVKEDEGKLEEKEKENNPFERTKEKEGDEKLHKIIEEGIYPENPKEG